MYRHNAAYSTFCSTAHAMLAAPRYNPIQNDTAWKSSAQLSFFTRRWICFVLSRPCQLTRIFCPGVYGLLFSRVFCTHAKRQLRCKGGRAFHDIGGGGVVCFDPGVRLCCNRVLTIEPAHKLKIVRLEVTKM